MDTYQLLIDGRLKEALIQLEVTAVNLQDWTAQQLITTVRNTYTYLLKYAEQSMDDPQRENVYQSVKHTAIAMYERLSLLEQLPSLTGKFAEKARWYRQNPISPLNDYHKKILALTTEEEVAKLLHATSQQQYEALIPLAEKHWLLMDDFFEVVWSSIDWSDEMQQDCKAFISDKGISPYDVALLVSALTLNLYTHFNAKKLDLLFHAFYQRTEEIVTERALTGILTVIYHYDDYMEDFPVYKEALEQLKENKTTQEQVQAIFMQLMLTRETKRAGETMQTEIIPTIVRNARNISKDGINFVNIDEQLDNLPEWDKDRNDLQESIERMAKMQSEGIDTYMTTFAPLKQMPFYYQPAHWFYVFHDGVPFIAKIFAGLSEEEKSSILPILYSTIFCNSDKYSLCLLMRDIPEEQRRMFKEQFIGKNDISKLPEFKETDREYLTDARVVRKHYIQDLYRYVHLSKHQPFGETFYNPWAERSKEEPYASFGWSPLFHKLLLSESFVNDLSRYLMEKGYYEEAIDIFSYRLKEGEEEMRIYEDIGYCYEKLKNVDMAIMYYELAVDKDMSSQWLRRHLAKCYLDNGSYGLALDSLMEYEEYQTKETPLINFYMGFCYYQIENYKEALKQFHKAAYLGYRPSETQRHIALCHIAQQEFEKAWNAYESIVPEEYTMEDLIRKGHLAYINGGLSQALPYYKEAYGRAISNDAFTEMFYDDDFVHKQLVEDELWKYVLDIVIQH